MRLIAQPYVKVGPIARIGSLDTKIGRYSDEYEERDDMGQR